MNTNENLERAMLYREAGQIQRCHNRLHLTHYSVAEHCYNMIALGFVLCPEVMDGEFILAIMNHDVPERFLGDLPAPAKWHHDYLAEAYLQAEVETEEALGLAVRFPANGPELRWLKILDGLELLMWAQVELDMGNKNMEDVRRLIVDHLLSSSLPEKVTKFINTVQSGRLPEGYHKGEHFTWNK